MKDNGAGITVARFGDMPAETLATLADRFTVLDYPEPGPADAQVQGLAVRLQKVDRAFLDRFPDLRIVASFSAGLDLIDLDAAKARGIVVSNTSDALAREVASFGVTLLLASCRRLVAADGFVHRGLWGNETFPLATSVMGLRVGIVGLGRIGRGLAEMLSAIGAEIAYFGRSAQDVPYRFFDDLHDMADWSGALVLTCPATPETRGLVDLSVLSALGPSGHLVNIARGEVVNTDDLCRALDENRIAGAALDVLDCEPKVPQALLCDPRVVLTPHIGSGTRQARLAMGASMVSSPEACLAP